jgi:hypothetical protein
MSLSPHPGFISDRTFKAQSKEVSKDVPKLKQPLTCFSLQRPGSIQGNSCGIWKVKWHT